MKADAKCIHCSVKLEVGENFLESQAKIKKYWCTTCKQSHNKSRMWVNGKYISFDHPLHKAGRYKSFDDAAFAALEKDIKQKSGYVYAIRNPAWPDWVKIGKAVDAEDRLSSYQTSSPMRDYKLIHSVHFEDRNKAETKAHKIAATKASLAWDKSINGEWFCMTDEQAIDTIKGVANES